MEVRARPDVRHLQLTTSARSAITAPDWFTDPAWALPSIIGIDFWHTIGYTFLIMLAGLQTVPDEMTEAARVDGANRVQTFFCVTLPLMTPTMFFASVITFIGAFQIFDPIQIITQGGPNDSTITAVMYLYQTGFQAFQIGYASTDRPGRLRGDHAGDAAAVLGITEVGAQRMTATTQLRTGAPRRPHPPRRRLPRSGG